MSPLLSQESATGPFSDRFQPSSHIYLTPFYYYLYIHILVFQADPLFSGFASKMLFAFFISIVAATCPAHQIHIYLIILIILGEEQTCEAPHYVIPESHGRVVSTTACLGGSGVKSRLGDWLS
jgi:hypothetical protein